MAQGNRIFYAIPGKRVSVYIDPDDGHIYQNNFGNTKAKISKYDAGHIRTFVNSSYTKNNPFTRNLASKVEPTLKNVENVLLEREQQRRDASSTDGNSGTANKTGKPKRPRGTGGGTQTPPQTPTYNYNFGQYYTDNPNGDKSKPVVNNYFNADQYSNFKSAFKAASDAGHGVFTWRGKAYNTMNNGDNATKFRQNHADYDAFIGNAHRGIQGEIDNSGGWSNDTNYKQDQIVQTSNPVPESTPQQQPQIPQQTRLEKFTDDDIRSLNFHNYQGLFNAAMNPNNRNNRFLQAMYNKYGDPSKTPWNQTVIESDLGVRGKYRRFGGGDFGDMSRSMMAWVGKNNGEIDKQNLLDRTGSNGTVYSSKEMRDVFESHNPNRQQSTQQTGTTNTSGTTSTTTGSTSSTNNSYSPNQYKWQLNTKNNNFQINTDNPWLNAGYAIQHQNNTTVQKHQKGGTINMEEQQLQQAFLQYLMQKTGAKDQQQLEQVIQQLGEDGLKQAYSQFLQEMQQQQVQAAKFGAKLNYIRHLNGQCPDGTEMTYFKVGGKLCKKCMQRQQKEQEAEEPSDPIKAFKCGRKMKRK